MKELFSVPGNSIRLVDKKRMIFSVSDGCYYDISGKQIPAEDGFDAPKYNIDEDPWNSYWIKDEGLDEPLIAESVEEVIVEIDDCFGKYGFKNRAGVFVIEPQYACSDCRTCTSC